MYDRRLARVSAWGAPVNEVARVLALFGTCYRGFTATRLIRSGDISTL